jgi:hypothetical protein
MEQVLAELAENDGRIGVYDDVLTGSDYIQAVEDGDIAPTDMVLIFSTDGAQLYKKKASDTWISIYIIVDHPPDAWYKKNTIGPAFFVPGPNKMKVIESFLLPTLHHLSALQKEGLQIWDADLGEQFMSRLFLMLWPLLR